MSSSAAMASYSDDSSAFGRIGENRLKIRHLWIFNARHLLPFHSAFLSPYTNLHDIATSDRTDSEPILLQSRCMYKVPSVLATGWSALVD